MSIQSGYIKKIVQDSFFFIRQDSGDPDLFAWIPAGIHFKPGPADHPMAGEPLQVRTSGGRDWPIEGIRVVYTIGRDDRQRPKANFYGYEPEFDSVLEEMDTRLVYKAMEKRSLFGKDDGVEKELWRGFADGAEIKFPLPTGRQSPGSDPMLPYYSDPDQIFETRRWWESKTPQAPDSDFVNCADPRPLPGVLRQFENINRR